MKVKDLIEQLKTLPPETVVNHMMYALDMPDYYDGSCVEVGEMMGQGEMRKLTVRRGTNVPKLNFYSYGFEDYFFEAGYEGIEFDKACGMIDFQMDIKTYFDREKESWQKSYDQGAACAKDLKARYPDKHK